MTHTSNPQVGEQVQITIGLDKGKRYTVIGAYSDQVELGDENGKFIRSASAVICNVCPPPAANTDGESLAARAAGGQGVDTTLQAARTVQWLLGECFCAAADGSPEERACLSASIAQDLRVLYLERCA